MLQHLLVLDTPTLYSASSLVFAVMAAILCLVAKRYSGGFQGIQYWAAGTGVCAVSFLLFYLRPTIGVPLSSLVGMTAMVCSLSLIAVGIESFFSLRKSTSLQLALLSLYLLWQAFFNFVLDNVYYRIFGFGLVVATIAFCTVHTLRGRLRNSERATARFTIILFCTYGMMALVRSGRISVPIIQGLAPPATDPTSGLLVLMTLGVTMLLVFSLITMLYRSQTLMLLQRTEDLAQSRADLQEHCRSLQNTVEEKTFQLYEAEKLVTIGTLAAGVAHEISTPNQVITSTLATVRSFFQRVENFIPRQILDTAQVGALPLVTFLERIRTGIGEAQQACVRIAAITNDLRVNADRGAPRVMEVVNLADMLKTIVSSVRIGAGDVSVDYTLECTAKPIYCRCYRHQIEQVVVNLLRNALQAIGSAKGAVRVSLDTESEYALLRVADNGCGIDKASLGRVTSPFYTTRRAAGGTGLGLFVVSRILHEHGGDMIIDSEPGEGTVVTVLLRRCDEA